MMPQWCHNMFLVGKSVHVPRHLSGGHHSEQNAEMDALLIPFAKEEIATPGVYCDTLPQVPQHTPTSSQPGCFFVKHI